LCEGNTEHCRGHERGGGCRWGAEAHREERISDLKKKMMFMLRSFLLFGWFSRSASPISLRFQIDLHLRFLPQFPDLHYMNIPWALMALHIKDDWCVVFLGELSKLCFNLTFVDSISCDFEINYASCKNRFLLKTITNQITQLILSFLLSRRIYCNRIFNSKSKENSIVWIKFNNRKKTLKEKLMKKITQLLQIIILFIIN